jgi:superfamily II DNA or RNA helicase
MRLRPYQEDMEERTRKSYREGHKSPLLVLPCGGGKAVIAADIAKKATNKGIRVLFLVHRIELKEQITETFIWWGVDMNLCDIEMVQSATKKYDKIPGFIITDESHHGTASTYINIYNRFPDIPKLLMTATPKRTNGAGLGQIADDLIIGVTAKWLIENKYLAPYEYYSSILIDENNLVINKGEYEQNSIISEVNRPKIYGAVIDNYIKFANNKKTIVFCASVEHSKKMCEEFNSNGIKAEHIDGTTKKDERKNIMDKFRNSEIMILCNYEIISEGLSVDDCECCILLRPTTSMILHVQSSMRCMRYQENKTAIILDLVGNYTRHGLPDTEQEWDLNSKVSNRTKNNEVSARQCGKCYKVYAGINPVCPYCGFNNRKD